jgi:hypothetical protein
MTKSRKERRITAKAVRRTTPDMRKLAAALIELARAEIEDEAEHRLDDFGQGAA